MAYTKVSALTAKTTPAGTEELLINDGGVSKKITQTNLLSTALPKAGGTMTGTIAGFTSTGIDDNATSTKVTVSDTGIDVTGGITATDSSTIIATDGVADNEWLLQLKNQEATDSRSYGVLIHAGSTASDTALLIADHDNVNNLFKVAGDGDVLVPNGNLVIGTSGKGIDFSADGNAAGMTSEVLDDYEEGTHALALTPATSGSITLNTSYDTLKYVKIGNLVFVSGRVEVSSVSSPVGGVGFSLPFAAAATPNGRTASAVTFRGLDIPAAAFNIAITVNGGASSAYLSTSEDNTANWPAIDGTAFSGDERFYFSLTYQTD